MDYSKYAFIFDMDGTIVDNMKHHGKSWAKLFEKHNVDIDAEEFLHHTAGKTFWETLPTIFPGISDDEIREMTRWKEDVYHEIFLPHRRLVEGLEEFMAEAVRIGAPMAVATAATPRNVEFILDGLDIRKNFGAVVTAADVSNGKPDPEIFLKSAERLGVQPANCIVFEDAYGGFEAAKRAGMRAIGIATVHSVDNIKERAAVVDAAPDFTGFNPIELLERLFGGAV